MGKWEPTNAGDFCCHLSKWRLWCASRVFHDWLGIQSWWFISIFTFNLDIDWGIYLNVQEKKAGSWKHVAKRGKSLCHVDGAYEAVGIVVYNNSLEDPPPGCYSCYMKSKLNKNWFEEHSPQTNFAEPLGKSAVQCHPLGFLWLPRRS